MSRAANAVVVSAASLAAVIVTIGDTRLPAAPDAAPPKAVLVIHGGAGVITPAAMARDKLETGQPVTARDYEDTLARALEDGYRARQEKTGVDAVEVAIRVLEDSE